MDKETQKQIAETILSQLGGKRFIAMTGANGFSFGLFAGNAPGLSFSIKGSRKWKGCIISLEANDTYTLKFIKGVWKGPINNRQFVMNENVITDVYCDMLQDVFTLETGLYTRL